MIAEQRQGSVIAVIAAMLAVSLVNSCSDDGGGSSYSGGSNDDNYHDRLE